jgi:hypothetical protein
VSRDIVQLLSVGTVEAWNDRILSSRTVLHEFGAVQAYSYILLTKCIRIKWYQQTLHKQMFLQLRTDIDLDRIFEWNAVSIIICDCKPTFIYLFIGEKCGSAMVHSRHTLI